MYMPSIKVLTGHVTLLCMRVLIMENSTEQMYIQSHSCCSRRPSQAFDPLLESHWLDQSLAMQVPMLLHLKEWPMGLHMEQAMLLALLLHLLGPPISHIYQA